MDAIALQAPVGHTVSRTTVVLLSTVIEAPVSQQTTYEGVKALHVVPRVGSTVVCGPVTLGRHKRRDGVVPPDATATSIDRRGT